MNQVTDGAVRPGGPIVVPGPQRPPPAHRTGSFATGPAVASVPVGDDPQRIRPGQVPAGWAAP